MYNVYHCQNWRALCLVVPVQLEVAESDELGEQVLDVEHVQHGQRWGQQEQGQRGTPGLVEYLVHLPEQFLCIVFREVVFDLVRIHWRLDHSGLPSLNR